MSQFSPYPPEPPPGKKSSKKTCLIILIILLVLAGLCCGGLFVAYLVGSGQISDTFRSEFEDHPAMLQHLGPIEEFQWDLGATIDAAQIEENVWVFRVKGEKGNGLLRVKFNGKGLDTSNILWAELEMDGKTYEIIPRGKAQQPLPAIDPAEMPDELPPLGVPADEPAP